MSCWDDYIDNLCAHSIEHCDKVAIIALTDGTPWTSHAHGKALVLSQSEAATIATALRTEDSTVFQQNGVCIGGVKYQFLRKDDNAVYAKKKDHGCITIQKTKTAIVVAHTAEGSQVGNTNKAVDNTCSYLESVNM